MLNLSKKLYVQSKKEKQLEKFEGMAHFDFKGIYVLELIFEQRKLISNLLINNSQYSDEQKKQMEEYIEMLNGELRDILFL